MRQPQPAPAAPVHGVLLVDKPEGPTSHDVVAAARAALGVRRIGHTGTLDPFASGLLLLCVGRATRLAEYLTALPKRYLATALLGVATDTDDRTGRAIAESGCRDVEARDVTRVLERLEGTILQRPPAYSAKKLGGERLYRKARRGERVEARPVRVTVHAIHVREIRLPEIDFEVACSSGTYVRAIARDLGDALGTGAHLTGLRRVGIGGHDVAGAVPLDRLDAGVVGGTSWRSPLQALQGLERIEIDEEQAARISHGQRVAAPAQRTVGGPIALAYRGRLVAIAHVEAHMLVPDKVFADA